MEKVSQMKKGLHNVDVMQEIVVSWPDKNRIRS